MHKAISICRMCTAACPIEVTVEDGRVTKVVGDRESAAYRGYSCIKGRALPDQLYRPDRLLHSQKRQPDGTYAPIASDDAVREISETVRDVLDRHGPRAIASFTGTKIMEHSAFFGVSLGFMGALGSPMMFSPLNLDQPGDNVASAYHGTWLGGEYRVENTDAWLLVGTNPLLSHQYWANNPVGRVTTAVRNGCRLVVIDPRVSESARHAAVHLRPRPGEDNTLLAGILALLFRWDALDHEFIAQNVQGVDRLKAAVAPFTPEYVSQRADVPQADFEQAARILAGARRGGVYCGTGTSMSNMGGNLAYYLALALNSLRGWWAREGEEFLRPHVLLPEITAPAQPRNPYPAANFGEKMRVRGLQGGITGVPAGAMFEEILTPGDGQIKVLFNFGGNPLMAVPDTDLAHKALSSLDLYVTTDVSMSNNARMADYVIAIKMGLEAPTTSYITEAMGYMHRGMGLDDPFAQYAPAAVDPPAGSDVIEEWQFYYRLAKALGMKLFIANSCGVPGNFDVEPIEHPLNMEVEPTTDEILELMCADARISWDELTAQRHGHVWEDLKMTVGPREPDCDQHLEVGEPVMMEYLEHHHAAGRTGAAPTPEYPFVFIGRRLKHVVNGTGQEIERLRREGTYNPVFMNPTDMAALQLTDGQGVEVRSAHGAIQGFVQRDDGLRTGVVSISHAFGRNPEDPPDPRNFGANTNQLLSLTAEYDPITGMPRMGAVPVAITRVDALAGAGHH